MLTKPYFGRLFFVADSGSNAGGSGGNQNPAGNTTPPGGQQGEPAGFQVIASEEQLREWKNSTRTHIRNEVLAELKADQDKRDADAKAEADRKSAEARGEFDAVKQSLESERDTARTERDAATAERDALATYFEAQFKSAIKDLPETIVAFAPAEDASFAEKSAWLTKAQEQAAKLGGTTTPGNGPNPKPGEKQSATHEQMVAQMRPNVSI